MLINFIKSPFKITLIVLILIFFIFSYFSFLRANTPEKAIKKYVFLNGHPIQAFNLTIRTGNYIDKVYGRQYCVDGYVGELGMEIKFFYLKQNNNGLWYVTTAGTGP